jgi:putative ABC transport system ATP-binding protein
VILEGHQLRKVYDSRGVRTLALDGVDLALERGEFAVLHGPSGCGKTTLLNLLGALDTPTEGRVLLEGRDLAELSAAELADLRLHALGFVFQAYNLIPVLTARENVEFVMELQRVAPAQRRARAEAILAEVGLAELADKRPLEMSGGQQQRVAVARAIVGRPQVVLADEPTANLDSTTSAALLDLMEALNREHGTTFLFSTHDPLVIGKARRRIRLHDGRVEADERAPR